MTNELIDIIHDIDDVYSMSAEQALELIGRKLEEREIEQYKFEVSNWYASLGLYSNSGTLPEFPRMLRDKKPKNITEKTFDEYWEELVNERS